MVYIDPPSPRFVSTYRRGVTVSWMVADDEEELHVFAESIGLKREWCLRDRFVRYDLGSERRSRALAAGAVQISAEAFGDFVTKQRERKAS